MATESLSQLAAALNAEITQQAPPYANFHRHFVEESNEWGRLKSWRPIKHYGGWIKGRTWWSIELRFDKGNTAGTVLCIEEPLWVSVDRPKTP